jgi:phage terminase large subunit-like protein
VKSGAIRAKSAEQTNKVFGSKKKSCVWCIRAEELERENDNEMSSKRVKKGKDSLRVRALRKARKRV